jgi:hypothetical protein
MKNMHTAKEIRMRAHGHAPVWRIPLGVGRANDDTGWHQQMNAWWTAQQAARHDTKLATFRARWDAQRETVRRLHADATIDLVASTHACSITTALCALAI